MTYFHPRDFDADQPIIPGLTKLRKFKAYVGITGAISKLNAVIATNSFSELSCLDESKLTKVCLSPSQ